MDLQLTTYQEGWKCHGSRLRLESSHSWSCIAWGGDLLGQLGTIMGKAIWSQRSQGENRGIYSLDENTNGIKTTPVSSHSSAPMQCYDDPVVSKTFASSVKDRLFQKSLSCRSFLFPLS